MDVVRMIPVLNFGVLGDRLDSHELSNEVPKEKIICLENRSSEIVYITSDAKVVIYSAIIIDDLEKVTFMLRDSNFFDISCVICEI